MRILLFVLAALVPAQAWCQCADVTAASNVTRSGYRLNRRINAFVQTVTVKNTSLSGIQGPLKFVVKNLSSGSSLANATGTSTCAATFGAPMVEVAVTGDGILDPGESVTFVVNFANPSLQAISYTPVVYAGSIVVQVLGNVTLSPDAIYIGEATTVTINARVPYDPALGIPNVSLERVDLNGNFLNSEGLLLDNGNLTNGDDIQGDGVFSGRRVFVSGAVGPIYLRVRVQSGNTTVTPIFSLQVFNHLTTQEFTGLQTVLNLAYQNFLQLSSTAGRQQATLQVIQQLQQDPDVSQAGLSGSSDSIWVVFKNGILGGIYLVVPGSRGGGEDTLTAQKAVAAAMRSASSVSAAAGTDNRIKSKEAIVIGPFTNIDPAFTPDETGPIATALTNSQCPKFNVTTRGPGSVNVETFKGLDKYGIVAIATHGDTFYEGILSLWQPVFQWNFWGAQVVMLTGTTATTANMVTYETDLKKGRMAIVGGTVGGMYAILPSFITQYSKTFPNSLIYVGACRSTYNNTMAQAFLGKGAGTYLGYSEYVNGAFATTQGTNFFKEFITNGKKTGDAFVPGQTDGKAFFQMLGANDLLSPAVDLQNGGFEDGTLGAWSAVGDGRVITQLGNWTPTEGNYMGIVSSGLGFTTSSGQVSQNVCIAPDVTKIEFNWNFSSEEFKEYCGSIFQDFFRVDLVPSSGSQLTVLNVKVDDLCSSVFKVGYSFDRGDVYSTGWRSTSADISAFANANKNKSVTIKISVGDVGDSIYDTAVLIDDIKLKK